MAKKILFIEDEERLRETLSIKLKEDGYEVFTATEGESGLKLAGEKKPDLILLDLILPKMDGFKVLEQLKSSLETKNIPVIVLTNLESGKDIEKVLNLGVSSYLVKANYSLEEISKKVSDALALI